MTQNQSIRFSFSFMNRMHIEKFPNMEYFCEKIKGKTLLLLYCWNYTIEVPLSNHSEIILPFTTVTQQKVIVIQCIPQMLNY